MGVMDLFKRKNKPALIVFCLFCCGLVFMLAKFDTRTPVHVPVAEDVHLKYNYHRRHTKRSGSLYIITSNTITDNNIPQLTGLTDVLYVHLQSSPNAIIDAVRATIENGASWLYLPQKQSENVNSAVTKSNFQHETTSLVYTGPAKESVDFHFIAQPFNSPTDYKRTYQMSKYETPLIQTFFQPDSKHVKLMDHRAPPVAVPVSSLYPFTKENTLYAYHAFWALVPLQVDNSIWSLWAGRLLHEINEVIMFHALPSGSATEDGLHVDSRVSDLKTTLGEWKCESKVTLFTCMVDLSKLFKDRGLFSETDVQMVERWIQELLSCGYQEPERRTHIHKIKFLHEMSFWPSRGKVKKESFKDIFNGACSKVNPSCPAFPKKHQEYVPNMLMIIVFNKVGFYNAIDQLETLYRPHFSQILYCGQDFNSFTKTHKNLKHKELSFIDLPHGNGQSGHQCIQSAIAMNYDVDGYLHLGDDVMFNFWNLSPLPLDKPWFQKDMFIGKLSQKKVKDVWKNPDWWPWTTSHRGVRKLKFTMYYLMKQKKSENQTISQHLGHQRRGAGAGILPSFGYPLRALQLSAGLHILHRVL